MNQFTVRFKRDEREPIARIIMARRDVDALPSAVAQRPEGVHPTQVLVMKLRVGDRGSCASCGGTIVYRRYVERVPGQHPGTMIGRAHERWEHEGVPEAEQPQVCHGADSWTFVKPEGAP